MPREIFVRQSPQHDVLRKRPGIVASPLIATNNACEAPLTCDFGFFIAHS